MGQTKAGKKAARNRRRKEEIREINGSGGHHLDTSRSVECNEASSMAGNNKLEHRVSVSSIELEPSSIYALDFRDLVSPSSESASAHDSLLDSELCLIVGNEDLNKLQQGAAKLQNAHRLFVESPMAQNSTTSEFHCPDLTSNTLITSSVARSLDLECSMAVKVELDVGNQDGSLQCSDFESVAENLDRNCSAHNYNKIALSRHKNCAANREKNAGKNICRRIPGAFLIVVITAAGNVTGGYT